MVEAVDDKVKMHIGSSHGIDFSMIDFFIDAIHTKGGVMIKDKDGIMEFFER